MKRLIKIACTLCILLALPFYVNAQWRFGLDGSVGFNPAYHYDQNGFFTEKDNTGRIFGQVNYMADYLLPRQWTPNWLTLSLRIGIGGTYVEDNSIFKEEYTVDDDDRTRTWITGIGTPIEAEVKYLISNSTRIYINGGITPIFAIDGEDLGYDYSNDFIYRTINIGYQFGVGFEFRNFRIGYKNFSLTKTITKFDLGNKLKSAHAISIGFWFNGNRTLKKCSKLKAY